MSQTEYFYTEALPRKSNDPRVFAAATATIVLWDGKDGSMFFLPQGGDPMRYMAKGFKPNPPRGWVNDLGRPVRPPLNPMAGDSWEPTFVKTGLQLEYERKLAEMQAESDRKESLRKGIEANQGQLASALERIAERLDAKESQEAAPKKRENAKA